MSLASAPKWKRLNFHACAIGQLSIPHLGGAEKVIVSVTELMVVALLAPTLWGLFSRCLQASAVWLTAAICFTAGVLVRFVWQVDSTLMKTFTGVILPVLILLVLQSLSRNTAPGYRRVKDFCAQLPDVVPSSVKDTLPIRVVSWSLVACGLLTLLPLVWDRQSTPVLVVFALVLFCGAGGLLGFAYRRPRR